MPADLLARGDRYDAPAPCAGAVVGNETGTTAAPDFIGNLVTTGRAASGTHPSIRVTDVDVVARINTARCTNPVSPLIRAQSTTNSCVVVAGDSGGPVYADNTVGRSAIPDRDVRSAISERTLS
jgi:hypothetical protein